MSGLPPALQPPSMTDADAFRAFIGCWQLVRMTIYHPDRAASHPLGEGATGQIMYSDDGHMSCHLMEANRPNLPGHGLDQLADAALGPSLRTYSGYFGSFSIDAAAGVVTHHVVGAWYPNMSGVDQPRRFAFADERLFLEADVGADLVRIEWRRHLSDEALRLGRSR